MAALLALAAPAAASAGPAGADRSAELVVPGQPDLERLQAAAGHGLLGSERSQPTVKKWKVALVLTDFPDKPFTSRSRPGGTIFGTPTAEAHSIPREQVPAFYRDFLNKPQPLNHFQTMNRYWMEDSFGKYGVQLDAVRPVPAAGPTRTSTS